MGDTGSLALGGYVAAIAFVLKMPIFIVIVAFIYLIEVISVMMQVTWFKYTKKNTEREEEYLRWHLFIITSRKVVTQKHRLLQHLLL